MDTVKDSLIDLERHRRRLEENINELQTALQHWRTWDAEYESLKEEVDAIDELTPAELERVRNEFGGELVNRKEVDDIFGRAGERSRDQIINILDRRIDYVTKSIQSLQRQLETAENKHAAASVISQPDAQDEEGQPITEILEELDDDDNVVSYKLNRPGQSLPHVREALQKAGIKDLPPVEEDASDSGVIELPSAQEESRPPQPEPRPTNQVAAPKSALKRKGVSFAEDTKPAAEPDLPPKSWTATRVENIMKTAKDQEGISKQKPVIPEDEDPEDAALRQEMLRYGMGEVGAVVAELQLEEDPSDMDEDTWDYSDEGFGEGEDEDEEDTYGRSTGRTVTDKYRQRMLELEQRLGIKSRFTEPMDIDADEDGDASSDDERIGRIVVNHNADPAASASQTPVPKPATRDRQKNGGEKKGVRFADSLDIAPDSLPATALPIRQREPIVEPLGDIMERSSSARATETKSARKPSRFKKTRDETSQPGDLPKGPLDAPPRFVNEDRPVAPSGPEGTTIAETLVERETVSRPTNEDEPEDFLDPFELADEHQRLRKKFIQRQGGFLKEDESPIKPLDEEDGGPARQSRFKAARLAKY